MTKHKYSVFWDVLFVAVFLSFLGLAVFMLIAVFGTKEKPPASFSPCNCQADVDATARNCVEAFSRSSEEFDRHIQEVFNALEACIWLEEEGYAAVEDTPIGDPDAWRNAMSQVDKAEIFKNAVWLRYHDYYGEDDLWDL